MSPCYFRFLLSKSEIQYEKETGVCCERKSYERLKIHKTIFLFRPQNNPSFQTGKYLLS
ncbi:hypothetical protein DMR_41860 [Solidesulfovibrio magneticus RS-1]|uniref:Uncharacterized protein n=1 Tax=Solidesulfovibrio magneticus (strain ATCC 700980 / DSM 13731 / RS-1) TaxID=573370 RepID=C4XPX7_SOLM1|nr:hypothetical protein DMR_41860 [Solidesulfovibrio magneticus RS-1]